MVRVRLGYWQLCFLVRAGAPRPRPARNRTHLPALVPKRLALPRPRPRPGPHAQTANNAHMCSSFQVWGEEPASAVESGHGQGLAGFALRTPRVSISPPSHRPHLPCRRPDLAGFEVRWLAALVHVVRVVQADAGTLHTSVPFDFPIPLPRPAVSMSLSPLALASLSSLPSPSLASTSRY